MRLVNKKCWNESICESIDNTVFNWISCICSVFAFFISFAYLIPASLIGDLDFLENQSRDILTVMSIPFAISNVLNRRNEIMPRMKFTKSRSRLLCKGHGQQDSDKLFQNYPSKQLVCNTIECWENPKTSDLLLKIF